MTKRTNRTYWSSRLKSVFRYLLIVALISPTARPAVLADIASASAPISYPDFSSMVGLNPVDTAAQVGDRLRLVTSNQDRRGAAWYDTQQDISKGFDTVFRFQIADIEANPFLPPPGADGFAFVIQNQSAVAIGADKGGIGYEGIPSSIAVEFDVWPNNVANCAGYPDCPRNDPSNNHISVQTRGTSTNSADHLYSIGSTSAIPRLLDGSVYTARISYSPGIMKVYLNNLSEPVLITKIDLADSIDSNQAWVGFTAATGGAWAAFDLLNWSFTTGCEVPFFWQRDPIGIGEHPLRSLPGPNNCGTGYDTLGEGGCTLTAATMLFRYYGAGTTINGTEMTPPNLSDCMNSKACPFNWLTGAACSDGKASDPRRDRDERFSYAQLNQELNQDYRPVILQMCRPKGACNSDGPITHWVLVIGGQGTDPANYTIWDPWFECGQNMRLNSRSDTWDFVGMAVYDGTPTCSFSTGVPLCARSVSPVGLPSGANASIAEQNTPTPVDLTASSSVSGTAVLYRATNITMTIHLTAQSSVGNVTDMVIWSDTVSNTVWQPFAPYVWLPLSGFVYAQFRDDIGNISAVVSDTPNPSAPPVAPDPDRVHLPFVMRR